MHRRVDAYRVKPTGIRFVARDPAWLPALGAVGSMDFAGEVSCGGTTGLAGAASTCTGTAVELMQSQPELQLLSQAQPQPRTQPK